MTHFNLNRMLQGCSAFIQTMAGDRAARNDAKRVNNHVLPLICPLLASSLRLTCPLQLRRIALILCVLVLSIGQAWGDTEVSFSPTGKSITTSNVTVSTSNNTPASLKIGNVDNTSSWKIDSNPLSITSTSANITSIKFIGCTNSGSSSGSEVCGDIQTSSDGSSYSIITSGVTISDADNSPQSTGAQFSMVKNGVTTPTTVTVTFSTPQRYVRICKASSNGKQLNLSSIKVYISAGGGGCSAPTSPSITGTTEYTAGQDISLTASATGTSASTTYTWYKGANWASASATTPVQAASTSGATFTKASCVAGDAGTYWCNISNGTGCEVQTSKSITVAATHTVTAATENASYGTAAAASTTVAEGATTTITATPKSGYQFDHWTVSGTGATLSSTTTNPTTLTMGTANATVTAYFAEKSCPSSGTLYTLTMKNATLSSVTQNTEVALATTYATESGGTAYLGNKNSDGGKAQVSTTGSGSVFFNGNDAYIKVDLDCPLATGDIITFTLGSGTKEICFTTGKTRATTYQTSSQSYTCDAAFNEVSTIYIWRVDGGTYLHSLTISRPAACTAPNHVDVTPTNADGWRYSLGETISLTATAYSSAGTGSPITSGLTYQWQKYISSTWTDINTGTNPSAATATLQIANCGEEDGGAYRCKVSTGAGCETISGGGDGYFVRVFTLYGGYSGQSFGHHKITWTSTYEGTVTINLNASSSFKFKFTDNDGKWYGNSGTISKDLASTWDWGFGSNTSSDATLTTGSYGGGNYVITVDITHFDDGGSKYVNLRSVVYPKKTTYLQLCSDWKAATAKYAIYYYKGGDNGWTDFMTAYACDGDILSADVPVWATNAFFVRFNPDKSSTGNFDYEWNRSGDNESTLPTDGKDYYHSLSVGGNGKYYGTWGTFSPSTFTITFANGGGTGSMSAIGSIACGADQALTANSFEKAGHTFSCWHANVDVKVGGATVTAGNAIANSATIQDISSNITLTAQWTPNNYDLTWDLAGGTTTSAGTGIGSGVSSNTTTSQAFGTALTAPTVTKTGYNFSAWSPAVASTMPAANTTYTATWTAKTTTITIDANTSNHGSTAPSPITATYGSALPSFTAAAGESGWNLTGYFTVATSGTKVINADGTLVASTDYADGDGKWKYETATLTLYAQYEEEADACYEFTPATSGSAPSKGDVINGTGSGGTMVAGTGQSYTANGLKFESSGDYRYVTVTLDNNLKEGSVIAVTMWMDGTSSNRGLYLQTSAGTQKAEWKFTADSENHQFSYTVEAGDGLINTNVFRLARINNVYLKSVTVSNCGDAACSTPTTAFANGAYTVGGSALDLSTLISGKQGSGAITYTVKNANSTGATIAGTSFTATSAGTAIVTATQAANGDYCEKVMDATITISAAAGHTVTYKYNGATSGASPASATGASVTLPTPTRTGYELDGWYKTDGTKVEDGGETYVPEADITLYARWQEACDAGGVAKSTADVPATGYTTYQEVGGSNVAFTSAPSLGFKYKDADGNPINNSKTAVVRNNAYSCKIQSSSSNKGSIKTNSTFSNVDSISFYFAASDKDGCKIAVWCSTDNFSADSTQLLSATTYAGSNSEFKLKTLAIPSGKKASALTFKFRFTVTGSGKTCYMDSLKVYSSTSGGGTCYHVYYHGNGAESGYVNDTLSYTAGSKATVLNYNYGRYPLAKVGYEFRGWATSAGGTVAYSAGQKIDITSADVDLYAVWATESSALVTWKMKTANDEAWATTTGTGTTDETNITSISTAHDEGDNKAKNSATAKTAMASGEVSSTAAPNKSARFTFTIAGGKQVEINKFDCEVFNVASGSRTYKAQISDAAGNVYNSTNTVAVSAEATLTDASFVFGSGKILRGAVTIRIYAWGSGSDFRMGPDVKFYGTVEDYECATPAAPTISGVSEYVPGQTITLTASHDGENYDNLTTYTWYKGTDWATASGTTPVQAAATGESGYTLTIADCTTGNAGKYWCKVSNGSTCNAYNSEGYDVTVFPAYTITYHLDGGTLDGEKTSYTQFDEDYTLPTPTKTGFVFAGWYGASDFSGLPTVVLGSGSVGDKEYYAKWGAVVTVSWTVDDELYRGGGGYSVKAVIDQTTWNESYKDQLELTATEGVTLKNIVASVVSSHVQVTADFDITTGLAADATEITFTLNVPADGTYGPKVDEHEETLTSCGGGFDTDNSYVIGKSNSDATNISSSAALRAYKTASDWYSKGNTTFTDKTSTDGFSITASEKSYYWQNNGTFTESSSSNCRLKTIKLAKSNGVTIRWTNDELSFSKVRFIGRNTAAGDATTFTVSNGTTEKTFTFEAGNSEIQTKEVTMDFVSGDTKGIVISGGTKEINILIELIPASVGGVTPTLTWDDGDADIANDGVSKSTSNDDFIYTASQDKNSLGVITYSSSDATIATVNATTGQVHLVGAAGSATITATIAASGCFSSANVSYTITVTDDCDDEAGTIATEDLGCSGVKMTVIGHTTTGETVSYQWYKVGTPSDATVGTDQDNFTATEAGSYYVIVTNTGDRHCAKRSTNTVTVEAKAAATVTKIVDSWYVKNGRRTPDIELVKTTNATSFTVTSGSSTIWESAGSTKTGFGGCGFHMDENGIIYLNGTKDGGAATTGLTAGDETLTITAIGCGSSASQTITIHCQAATNYKEIAFVADGGKGMKKDSITVGHGDGTELYEYLDSVGTAAKNRLFKLSERNIYWTTDEKAIREEYSQFDGILITDDPSTNTVVKDGDDYKTKGYVNAFGTMVDVRPIFTMEAYVSALNNWGAKGIAGNPESPNPRQYEMRLECKDHEIYGAGLPTPEDGTNVWEEVIDGEIFRHVILVDSMKGVYKGVAYNAETAGNKKPALQGFTGEAAGSLLGLGRILEGTLQAAIERQEEPAARLLVMGINAKALQPTCALTDEGKTVIKNILVYLLKTNMEEVDDCSNYFTGKIDSDWSKAGNWSKSALPSSEAKVRILAPCVISGIKPHVLQVSIVNSGNSNIRYTATSNAVCNGTLTINADGALIADGKVRSAVAPHFAANDLMPTTPEMLTINTGSDGQAALIFNNDEGLTKATVNYYSRGRKSDDVYQFQYFAVPMEYVDVNPAFAGSGIYTYAWHENGGWERRGYYTELYAFEGLGITTKFANPRTYTMKGTLASTAEREVTLTHESPVAYGNNIIGNSWMAPINIASLKDAIGDDDAVQKTVYIYSTGNDKAEGRNGATSSETASAGQWLAIPIDASGWSGWEGLKVIPAMQAFMIRVNTETSLTLNYNDMVRSTAIENMNVPLRAPKRNAGAQGITLTRMRVEDSNTHTDMYLFEGERFNEEFDNGWEAVYMPGNGSSAQFYAMNGDEKMAVLATNDLEGTYVGFAPGKESNYTISFFGGEGTYYLNDLKEEKSTLIEQGNTYSFTYEEGDMPQRFLISTTPFGIPGVTTGVGSVEAQEKVQKVIYNDHVYIIRGGQIYDIMGKMIK